MHTTSSSLVISKPVGLVYSVDTNPLRLPEYVQSVVSVKLESAAPGAQPGRYSIAYGIPRMTFEGQLEILEKVPQQLYRFCSSGAVGRVIQTNTYRELRDGTEVTWQLELQLGTSWRARAAGVLLSLELSERALQRDLARLNAVCQAAAA